jgi:hypothetical protein
MEKAGMAHCRPRTSLRGILAGATRAALLVLAACAPVVQSAPAER